MLSHFAGVVNGIACYLIKLSCQRLVFDRECSNRSGDVNFCAFLTNVYAPGSSNFLLFQYIEV